MKQEQYQKAVDISMQIAKAEEGIKATKKIIKSLLSCEGKACNVAITSLRESSYTSFDLVLSSEIVLEMIKPLEKNLDKDCEELKKLEAEFETI